MEFRNSTIVITGGTSGIGLELVRQLSDLDVNNIIITGRDSSKLEKVKKQYPLVHTFQSDVSKPSDIETLNKQVTQQFPETNILINNAGVMRNLNLLNTNSNLEDIIQEIDTNLSGCIRMIHQFLPHLQTKKSAAIINISSGLAFIPYPASPIYSAAKAGLHAYTQVLRLQLKQTNIKVIEVAPPSTETPLQDDFKGIVDSRQNMSVENMVRVVIDGIQQGKTEISPGAAKILKVISRIAPRFFSNFMDQSIMKAKSKQAY